MGQKASVTLVFVAGPFCRSMKAGGFDSIKGLSLENLVRCGAMPTFFVWEHLSGHFGEARGAKQKYWCLGVGVGKHAVETAVLHSGGNRTAATKRPA